MTKTKKKDPETVIRIRDISVPLQQAVYRNNKSSMFGFWQAGGTFNLKGEGIEGEFGSILPGGNPVIHVKWKGRDGSDQSSSFTVSMRDIIDKTIDAIKAGDAEERKGGDAATSARPVVTT